MRYFIITFVFVGLIACEQEKHYFEIHGHRGYRGHYPENSISGFVNAAQRGLEYFDMGVIISGDGLVVVSNEPWLSHQICYDPNGNPIYESTQKAYNLYQMRFEQISKCECGLRKHPDFPNQERISSRKPLLSQVVDTLKKLHTDHGTYEPHFNINIKSNPETDNVFHPTPSVYVDLVVGVLKIHAAESQTTIQSSDIRVLQYVHTQFPQIRTSLIIEENEEVEPKWLALGFTPDIISPHYSLVDSYIVSEVHQNKALIIPWTVNELHIMEKLRQENVDGIITDFPNHLLPPLSSARSAGGRP